MHFITALLHKIKNTQNNKIELLGTVKPLRQFMYAGDLANIIKLVIDNNIIESFNVAPNWNYSIKEMAELAVKTINPKLKINFSNPELDGQYRKDVDNTKMKNLLPNFKFTPLEEGILKTYNNE
jgi:GDP-L-fucose synthase